MTDQSSYYLDSERDHWNSDWNSMDDDGYELTPEQITRALAQSQTVPNTMQQWTIYLHALALEGFKEWLDEWGAGLFCNEAECSSRKRQIANLLGAVCNLGVGNNQLCLLATTDRAEFIYMPRAVVELPQWIPDYYLWVEVQDEEEWVKVQGYLHREELQYRQRTHSLSEALDWAVAVPAEWFHQDLQTLLTEIRYVSQPTIAGSPLPAPISPTPAQLAQLEAELRALLPQLRSPDCLLKRVLSWEQGRLILSQPELARWLVELQSGQATEVELQRSMAIARQSLQTLAQSVINTGLWMYDQMDRLAQELAWMWMPPLFAELGLRLPTDNTAQLVDQLSVPTIARGAFLDSTLGTARLRINIITWNSSSNDQEHEWTLLVIVQAQPDHQLPNGILLTVQDAHHVLDQQVLTQVGSSVALYSQVVGSWEEWFWVRVSTPNGLSLILPPFAFDPTVF